MMDNYECSDLLRTRINWSEIFGTVYALKPLKGNQYNFMKSDMQERSAEKHSGGLLKYIGNTSIGKDYEGLNELDGLRFESKTKDKNLIQSLKMPHTTEIILKNFQENSTGIPEQTFDYLFAYDCTKNTVLLASWDVCMHLKHLKVNDATITTRLLISKCDVLARDVIPVKKNVDPQEEYKKFADKFM